LAESMAGMLLDDVRKALSYDYEDRHGHDPK
jgi:hypothetical protein